MQLVSLAQSTLPPTWPLPQGVQAARVGQPGALLQALSTHSVVVGVWQPLDPHSHTVNTSLSPPLLMVSGIFQSCPLTFLSHDH